MDTKLHVKNEDVLLQPKIKTEQIAVENPENYELIENIVHSADNMITKVKCELNFDECKPEKINFVHIKEEIIDQALEIKEEYSDEMM